MKRILVATPLYPPEQGGPRTYTLMLEDELPKHEYEVNVIPFARARSWPKLVRHIVYGWLIFKAARSADIVYALDPVSVGLPTMLAARLRRKSFMIRIPGDYAWEQGQIRFGVTETLDDFVFGNVRRTVPVRVLQKIQTIVTRQAKVVVVPSQYMKRIVSGWGVSEEKIHPIYTALRRIPVSAEREKLRAEWNFTGTVLLSIARLTPWKGLTTLVECLPEIKKQIPDIKLVIIGEGPEENGLKKRAAELNLGDAFCLYGAQEKIPIGEVTVAADIFVLNTAYEGLSHQLLETMDLGTPIITTNVGGNPELITNEETGLIVEYDDTDALIESVIRLATDTDLRNQLTTKAKEKAGTFEQSTVVLTLVKLLNSIS